MHIISFANLVEVHLGIIHVQNQNILCSGFWEEVERVNTIVQYMHCIAIYTYTAAALPYSCEVWYPITLPKINISKLFSQTFIV